MLIFSSLFILIFIFPSIIILISGGLTIFSAFLLHIILRQGYNGKYSSNVVGGRFFISKT